MVDLITEFLLDQGVQPWLISASKWRADSSPCAEQITVYLCGYKLHFIIEGSSIDCVLYSGGMATSLDTSNLIKVCIPRTDIRDPNFFKKLLDGIWPMKLGHPSVAVKEL